MLERQAGARLKLNLHHVAAVTVKCKAEAVYNGRTLAGTYVKR